MAFSWQWGQVLRPLDNLSSTNHYLTNHCYQAIYQPTALAVPLSAAKRLSAYSEQDAIYCSFDLTQKNQPLAHELLLLIKQIASKRSRLGELTDPLFTRWLNFSSRSVILPSLRGEIFTPPSWSGYPGSIHLGRSEYSFQLRAHCFHW